MILFFDTETTGLVKNWDNPHDEKNPNLVQLGMLLCSTEGRIVRSYSSIVKPNNYTIPSEVAAIHGITTDFALKVGIELEQVKAAFLSFIKDAHLVVAHNLKFDKIIVQKAFKTDVFTDKQQICTMLGSTPICKLPSKNGGFKWPKLKEAYKYFFNEELKDAHDAITDTNACKRVYFEIKDK